MANNLVVQLLLKTGAFSSDLKQARGQLQSFQQGCTTAGKSLTQFGNAMGINIGALTKFGGVVGVAVAAGKELKAIIDSNQTSADAFQGVIAGCTGVIETFNQAIATVDFSYFRDGIWSVYDAAKAARDAIDALNDASLAYGYLSKKNQTKFQEGYNVFKDPHATQEMKDAAKAQMKEAVDAQFDYASVYGKKQMDAYVTQVVKEAGKSNLEATNVTSGQFVRAMNIKLGLEGDTKQIEKELDRQYKEFQGRMKEYGKNNIAAQAELKKQYADVIAIRAMVKGMNDDQLKNVVQIVSGMEDAQQTALSMEKTMNRAESSSMRQTGGGGSKTTKSLKEELVVQEQSLEYWNKIAQEAKKHRDVEVFDSKEWNDYNNALTLALEKIEGINGQMEMMEKKRKNSDLMTPITIDNTLQGKAEPTNQIGLNGEEIKTKRSVKEIENLIQVLTEMRDVLVEGDPLIERLNVRIENLGKDLENIKGVGIKAPEVKKETIDTWDEFNNAMSNTSTIVSSLTSTFKEGTEVTAASILSMVSTALPALGSLISSIEALSVAEAVEAGVAATGKAVSSSKHWIEAIAAVAALGSVVAAAVSAARSNGSKKYANGGIVGGNSFTGDRVTAQVNSGEMILNKTQQSRLFKLANGAGGGRGGQVEFHISGTELVGVLNNVNRKNKVIR